MSVLELFAGTGSFSRVARQAGHNVFTSDYDPSFNTDYCIDIMDFDIEKLPFKPDVIWASPPCETFSVASIGHHWTGGKGAYVPKTERAKKGKAIVLRTIHLINKLKPKYWFIENPRGVLRKMPFMQDFNRYTVTYCQYGDTRMKPTDIWTNANLELKPMCKNGMPCHISAPRGSKTGTQGIKTYRDRSVIPSQLCEHIISQLERTI
ncbi:MAG TPA: DNA cytosine methyltransferase [Candidatus Saccharibacteria bacterium]|nr:DNA cytosine methyltransferase [Candidatus Saccharibacteria bacterium]